MFKIASASGDPPQTPLGEFATLLRPLSREGHLAFSNHSFSNHSFAPWALNSPLAPQKTKIPALLAPQTQNPIEPPLLLAFHCRLTTFSFLQAVEERMFLHSLPSASLTSVFALQCEFFSSCVAFSCAKMLCYFRTAVVIFSFSVIMLRIFICYTVFK